ncbi:MAG: DUF2029 domain-containing protein [Anaerolineae bacterium]|nr:DUF2029 domain-containing protein [Anaerolineae bacterium]
MKRKVILAVILGLFGVMVGMVYARNIIPNMIDYPLRYDIAQDYIGAQALVDQNEELYPILTTAYEKMGITWQSDHRSTHPPTAYLLVVPFTLFDYPTAQTLWMISMLACIVITFRAFNLSWKMSLFAGLLSLAWPPAIWSLGQFTAIWMLGLALAYRFRDRPLLCGLLIGLASLPKYFAAALLIHPVWRKRWAALIGFAAVWLAAISLLLLLRVDSISAYVASNVGNSMDQILRPDNGALAIVAWRMGGWPGIAAVVVLTLCVFWIGLRNNGVYGWACLVWVGIACLPITWVYSLLPLLPWLVITLKSGHKYPCMLAVIALALPYASTAWLPNANPWFVALSLVFSGLAFALAASAEKSQKGLNNHPLEKMKYA